MGLIFSLAFIITVPILVVVVSFYPRREQTKEERNKELKEIIKRLNREQ